jgi:heptosyltransferase-2
VLIIKLGATGDVVRTTTLLRSLRGDISWMVEAKNAVVLQNIQENVRCVPWEQRDSLQGRSYDLVVNLEDSPEVGRFINALEFKQLWGAYADSEGRMCYSTDAQQWFDLSIISRHGRQQADELKFKNRRTYQDLIFEGLGLRFEGETYCLPEQTESSLKGDVAIAAEAGPVWPMKKWAYYDDLKQTLEKSGLVVNVLPQRSTLLEHLADVRNHRCLVGGDTLPMHLALGSEIPCVTLFNCTSPWEIHDYGLQKKIVSPLLEEFFYKRGFDERATGAITVTEVASAVLAQFDAKRQPYGQAVAR